MTVGESPAAYAHADQVATLTDQVRRTYPQALAWASDQAATLQQALARASADDGWRALTALVDAHQHLTGTELAHLPRRDEVADEVLTAALYLASGIDWAAVAIEVRELGDGQWRVKWDSGDYWRDVPVPAPAAPNAEVAR